MNLKETLKNWNEFLTSGFYVGRSLTLVESYVLITLYKNRDKFLSIIEISRECGVNAVSVWQAVYELEKLGKPLTIKYGLVEVRDGVGRQKAKSVKITWVGIEFVEIMGWNEYVENMDRREKFKKQLDRAFGDSLKDEEAEIKDLIEFERKKRSFK